MTKVELKARTAKARALQTALSGIGLTVQRPSGEGMTHTDALNVLARLDGFQSHSHFMEQSKKKARRSTPHPQSNVSPAAQKAVARLANSITAEEVVQDWLDAGNESKRFPRKDWLYEVENDNTGRTYPQWLLSQHNLHREFGFMPNNSAAAYEEDFGHIADICQEGTVFVPPNPTRLDTGVGTHASWGLEVYFTDRWGQVVTNYRNENKPSFVKLLLEDIEGFEYLNERMADEMCFIAAKDGKVGLLIEMEVQCRESEVESGNLSEEDGSGLPLRVDMRARVKAALTAAKLHEIFPYLSVGLAFDEDFESFERTGLLGFVTLEDMRKHNLQLTDISKMCDAIWKAGN